MAMMVCVVMRCWNVGKHMVARGNALLPRAHPEHAAMLSQEQTFRHFSDNFFAAYLSHFLSR